MSSCVRQRATRASSWPIAECTAKLAMRRFNEAEIRWISRVPETSTEAKAVVETAGESTEWQDSEDGHIHWLTRTMSLPQGQERLSSSCAPSKEKHERRRPSSGKWRKPSTAGSKSSGTCPTSILPGASRCPERVGARTERTASVAGRAERVREF